MSDQSGDAAAAPASPASPDSPASHALDVLAGMVALIEATPMLAVRCIDRDGAVRFWNRASAQLYGISAAAALGQPAAALLGYGEQEAAWQAQLASAWAGGAAVAPRDWLVHSSAGQRRWVATSLVPVRRDGQPRQLYAIDIDITARKEAEGALLQVGGNFRQLFEKSADAILLIEELRIADLNPAAARLFRCADTAHMLGQRLSDLAPLQQPGGAVSEHDNAAHAARAHADGNWRYEWRYVGCDGAPFWAEVLLTSITFDHSYLFYAVIRDISARKQAERSVYLAAQVFEHGRDAMLLLDPQWRVVACNRAFCALGGFGAADLLGSALVVYRDGAPDPAQLDAIVRGVETGEQWQGEIASRRHDGTLFPAWLAVTVIRDSNGAVGNYLAVWSDITARKQSEEHTRHLAEHDFLTDLPNRVLLLDRLSLALVAARRKHSMLAILYLDLDHFKNINDTMGHHVGDALLKEVARRLVGCVRGVDTVSRQGGDEFIIILADIGGVDQAAHVASSVLHAVAQAYHIADYELHVSTSIGLSVYPNDGADLETLVKNADIAMYHAKESGRNSFQFFNADMNARTLARASVENGLRRALDDDEFVLAFQPTVDVRSGAMVGAEALIRWRHPELGLLQPQRFIGVAEESGLMLPIGDWVLRQACRQARAWLDAGQALVVSVNLSAAQFSQKNLVASVVTALQAAGLAPGYLELELTEAILMKDGGHTGRMLAELHGLGVRLTIDDFGTGYSRLGHLRDYPVDKLKIDRSFMADLDGVQGSAGVITAIIAMARSLQLRVIAEGVETDAQLQFLRLHGCDEYQGFHASATLPGGVLGQLLA